LVGRKSVLLKSQHHESHGKNFTGQAQTHPTRRPPVVLEWRVLAAQKLLHTHTPSYCLVPGAALPPPTNF
jgi:hypothetical protein